jgi:hypothetical protein
MKALIRRLFGACSQVWIFPDFHGYTARETNSPSCGTRKQVYDAETEGYESNVPSVT